MTDVPGQTLMDMEGVPPIKLPRAKIKPDMLKLIHEALPTLLGNHWANAETIRQRLQKRGVFCSVIQLVHAAYAGGYEYRQNIETRLGWQIRKPKGT